MLPNEVVKLNESVKELPIEESFKLLNQSLNILHDKVKNNPEESKKLNDLLFKFQPKNILENSYSSNSNLNSNNNDNNNNNNVNNTLVNTMNTLINQLNLNAQQNAKLQQEQLLLQKQQSALKLKELDENKKEFNTKSNIASKVRLFSENSNPCIYWVKVNQLLRDWDDSHEFSLLWTEKLDSNVKSQLSYLKSFHHDWESLIIETVNLYSKQKHLIYHNKFLDKIRTIKQNDTDIHKYFKYANSLYLSLHQENLGYKMCS